MLLEQQDLSYQTFPYQMTLNVPAPISALPPVMDSASSHITYQAQRNIRTDDADVLEGIAIFLGDENAHAEHEITRAQQPTLDSMQSAAIVELDNMLQNLSIHEQIEVIKTFPRSKCLNIVNNIIGNMKELKGLMQINKLTIKELLILVKFFSVNAFTTEIGIARFSLNAKLTSIGLNWSDLKVLETNGIQSLLQLHERCIRDGNSDYLNKTVEYYEKIIKISRNISKANLELYLVDIVKAVVQNITAMQASQALNFSIHWFITNSNAIATALEKKYPDVSELRQQLPPGLKNFEKLKLLCDFIYVSEEFQAELAASTNESSASQIQTSGEDRSLAVSSLNVEEQDQYFGNEQFISQINTAIAELPDFADADSAADFDAHLDRLMAASEYLDQHSEEYDIEETRISPVDFHSNQTRIYDPRIFAHEASNKRGLLDTENMSTKKARQDRFNF